MWMLVGERRESGKTEVGPGKNSARSGTKLVVGPRGIREAVCA